jgi:hypothetical protein
MIQPLRRVHLWVFVVLAIALPLILLVGLTGRSKTVSSQVQPGTHLEKLP